MKELYLFKTCIAFILTFCLLFIIDDLKFIIGFLLYILLMYSFYIDEYLKEIKNDKKY